MSQQLPPGLSQASIRSLALVVVGLIARWAASRGIHLNEAWLTEAVVWVITVAAAAGYYVAVRILEHVRSSRWGWLLGRPGAPTYVQEE